MGALLLGAAPAAGEELERTSLDLWPFVVRDARAVAGRATTRMAGPFFESWDAPGQEQGWTLRPLAARRKSEDASRFEFLYPLGELRSDEDGARFRLTPFVDRVRRPPESDGERHGWTFLLAFGGTTPEGEAYGGLFPLGGVAKQRFGLERLDFWLFPFFARSRDASGYQKTHFLWPFFSWGSGGGRRTLRIWPFYGHDVKEGEFERRFALWPFVHWSTERPGDDLERRVRLFLPFYGKTERRHARSRFILGPLYMHAENDLTGAQVTDLLWPFVRFGSRPPRDERPGSRELRVEPFFRRAHGPGWRRTGTLFGAVQRSTVRTEELELDSFRLLFASRFERLHDRRSGETRERRQLWPFFRYAASRSAGAAPRGRLQVPWLLPFAGEAWLRHSLGLFTFYEREWQVGEERSDWLFGLARSRRAPDYRLDAVSWLYRSEAFEGSRRLRVLGIPFDSAPAFEEMPAPRPSLATQLPSD